jgi:hypothetical protein
VLVLCGLVLPGAARAAVQLDELRFSSTEADGSPSVLAGAHPDQVTTSFVVAGRDEGDGLIPLESPRNLTVDLPPGMVGNVAGLPTCAFSDFEVSAEGCPPESQIGYVELIAPASNQPPLTFPMYNLKPSSGVAAMFGLEIEQARTRVVARLDPARNYGVSIAVRNLPQAVPWIQLNVVIWGVPGGRPLLTNPSACSPALTISARLDSWQDPDVYDSATAGNEDGDGDVVGITDCEELSFDPSLTLASSAPRPRAPTGLTVALHAPQVEDAEGRAEADLEKATVTLPEGVSISPSAGAGLGACTATQIQLGSDDPPSCPDDSKLGTMTIETPLLDERLSGPIYLARPWDNPFGSRFAVYGVATASGVLIKLAGRVDADPATGQLRVSFDRLPQIPFRDLAVEFWGGPRSLLSNPSSCGIFTADAELSAWGAAGPVERRPSFRLSSGCSGPFFAPGLDAGVTNPLAGASSSFVLRLERGDLDGEFASLSSVDLPPGLTIALKGANYCPDSVLAAAGLDSASAPACPGSSRIGSVLVGAGPGPSPLYLEPGDVFLAGPYEGAPLSLALSVPARVGPFDLGAVIVRAPLRIDPRSLRVEIGVGRLPRMLAGIPLKIRDLRVAIDRPGFVHNPSRCAQSTITATVSSVEGMTVRPSSPFAVTGCRRLGFAPKLSLAFSGAPTRRGGHPRLRAVVTAGRGDANIARMSLTMPETELLDSTHIRGICGRRQFAAESCPARSIYGYARAWSPLLEKPLRGPVYLRSSNHMLPDLVASLDGQIHADLAGRIDSPGGRLRATFWAVPDVPLSRFVLTMRGGGRGLLVNNTELCSAAPRATARFGGQNGKLSSSKPPVKVDCGSTPRNR